MLSTANNEMAWCFAIVSSLAATTRKLINSRGANVTRDTIFKGEKAANSFISPKNDLKVNMGVNFTKKFSKSFLEVYTIDT